MSATLEIVTSGEARIPASEFAAQVVSLALHLGFTVERSELNGQPVPPPRIRYSGSFTLSDVADAGPVYIMRPNGSRSAHCFAGAEARERAQLVADELNRALEIMRGTQRHG